MSPPNVLLITVDGLRYDRLSRSGYDRETTPTLDALADAGASCENAMAAGTGTLMSFPGISTSSYPLMYGGYTELTDARETVASVFRDHGYATLGVNTNAQLHPTFGWDRGFDVYVDGSDVFVNKPVGTFAADSQDDNQSRVGAAVESVKTTVFRTLDNDGFVYRSLESAYRLVDDRSLPHPDATAVVDTVVDCWKKLPDDRPTFLWVHFMETHSPYLPPPEYRERFLSESLSEGDIWRLNDLLHEQPDQLTDEEVRSISDLYDASLRYLDDELDRLFAALGLNDGWGETCLAFTADHGEQFREHGGLTHCPQPYEEGIHVPLLFRLGERTLSDVTEITSTLDIAPALLEAALGDVETPERFWGQSLVGTLNDTESLPGGRVVFAELASQPRHSPRDIDMITRRTGCRTRRWKYVTSVDPDSPTLLFDLEEDPGEQNNVADEYQEVVKRFERLVEDHYDALAYTQYDLEIDTDVSEVQDRLRALGYVEE